MYTAARLRRAQRRNRLLLYLVLGLGTLAVNRCAAWHVRPRPAPEALGQLV